MFQDEALKDALMICQERNGKSEEGGEIQSEKQKQTKIWALIQSLELWSRQGF